MHALRDAAAAAITRDYPDARPAEAKLAWLAKAHDQRSDQ
jgi:hypothetical protein